MPETTLHQPKDYKALMLSSTFTDLREHRKRAIQAIHKLGYMARVMEHSGAQAEADVIDASLAMVRDAAAYIVVISFKYGQTPFDANRNPNRLSITELEFDEAMRLGRPIVLFIMGDDHPVKKADIESDTDKLTKLNEFRERAKLMRRDSEVHRVYETFDSLEHFSTTAATAIGNLVRYLERSDQRPKGSHTIFNIPINIPFHVLGRSNEFAAIDRALKREEGHTAIAALHGLRGVGKTTLAADYAVRFRRDYRAVWWIRAETESTMRADLVGLGEQLGWVTFGATEEKSVANVLERLCADGQGILLIYDNAVGARELRPFLPRGSASHIIITSNAPDLGGISTSLEIRVWSNEDGAEFLMMRTGRAKERDAALSLSAALEGLPLAHEQAAAYCDRVGISLAEYLRRFEAEPAILGNEEDASLSYGRTVAKTFSLAIDEAAKVHPAAESLIVYAALLAPEPIPLYLFSEAHELFDEPLASALAKGGVDQLVATLRKNALVDRESVPDERSPKITTDCIRLHRLVRQVATARRTPAEKVSAYATLIKVLSKVYPADVYRDSECWPRARRLDALVVALVDREGAFPKGAELSAAKLLSDLDSYRDGALADYAEALRFSERALAIRKSELGEDDLLVAESLNNLAVVREKLGDFGASLRLKKQALWIRMNKLGWSHPKTLETLNNIGHLLQSQNKLNRARIYFERVLTIRQETLDLEHPDVALSLNNLGDVLRRLGDLARARSLLEGARTIREKKFGTRALETAYSIGLLGELHRSLGDLAEALAHLETALEIFERELGARNPTTRITASRLATVVGLLGRPDDAAALLMRYGIED